MNYLVTGGAGFVGSKIADKLIQEGNQVVIIDNLSTGYLENVNPRATFIKGDCSNSITVTKMGEQYFDAIFHIAGQSSGEVSFEDPVYDINSNTVSTLLLLQYARKTGCKRFIYASTMSVYGDVKGGIVSENTQVNPKSFYAVGKLASEQYMRIYQQTYGITYTALRYFNIYGPGQNLDNLKQGMISIYLKYLISNKFDKIMIKGSPNRFRDFIYIDDVVAITLKCLDSEATYNKSINIGTGKKTTVKEVIRLLKEKSGIFKEVEFLPGTPGDQFGIIADNSLLKSFYIRELTEIDKGIELFVKRALQSNS
jgi:UDP-glucose 4-epimerase